jgi:hypothetical protein
MYILLGCLTFMQAALQFTPGMKPLRRVRSVLAHSDALQAATAANRTPIVSRMAQAGLES